MSSVKEKPTCNTFLEDGSKYYSPNHLQDLADKSGAWSGMVSFSMLSIIFAIIGGISYNSTGFSDNTKIYLGLITITLICYIYYYNNMVSVPSSWIKDCV
jgi:hypothetical protein